MCLMTMKKEVMNLQESKEIWGGEKEGDYSIMTKLFSLTHTHNWYFNSILYEKWQKVLLMSTVYL